MAKIIGNTTSTPNPQPDWNQTDSTKADYIKNNPFNVITEEDNDKFLKIVDGKVVPTEGKLSGGADGLVVEDDGGFKRLFLLEGETKLGDGVIIPQGGGTISNVGLESEIDDKGRKYLYLTVDGQRVGEGILLPQGGGGGGGGSTNAAVMTVANTTGWLSKSVAAGADCTLSVNWSSIEEGISTGNGTLMVSVGEVVKTAYEVPQGDVSVNVGRYLSVGYNEVKLTLSDIYGNKRDIIFAINAITVGLSSYFDGTSAYTGAISYSYIPSGGGIEVTVHFLIDGNEIGTQDIVANGSEKPYTIPAQSHGSHTLEVYYDGYVDGQYVASDKLYYDLICYESGNLTPIISAPFSETTIKQYATVAIPYTVYTPHSLTSSVELKENGNTVSTVTVDRTRQVWSYKAMTAEPVNLAIVCEGVKKEFSLNVTESDFTVSAVSDNLELYLNSAGRNNGEANALVWESQGSSKVGATLSNFNLTSDGWQLDEDNNTVLRVTGDARVEIPFNIFDGNILVSGKTIEIEFATRDILDYDATIISSWSGDRGIKITAQKATLKSQQSEVFTQFKEDETVRIAFVIEKKAEHRLLTTYINGVMSGAVQYPENDAFHQTTPVGISIGSNKCTTDIYCIRVYSNNLAHKDILQNWIADTQNVELMAERYNRNNIFDNYNNISISKLPRYLPYMILEAEKYEDLPQFKGDKKTIGGTYVDPIYPSRSFVFEGAEIDVQGTSSQYYSRKNYKIKFKGGFVVDGVPSTTYKLRSTSMPTDEFTFKADVASSEGANNVELVRLYDDTCPVKTPPQLIDSRVRQGIEGYPIVMFYGKGNKQTFLGKYNFNNDKATEEVFGFESGDESWEIRLNNTQMVIWKDDDFSGDKWKSSFEARYPDKSEDITNLQEFSSWLKSTDTMVDGLTEEEKTARLQKFKNEFGNYTNVDAMLFNYIFTETFLMTDNRAKNAFPTRYDEDGKWLILPYDMDTAIGINNEGELRFGYQLEDTDLLEGDEITDDPAKGRNVFNGQDSVLYVNMRLAYGDEIMAMYQELRRGDVFAYDEIEKRFSDHQAVWGEAIFNEDAKFKYIDPLINDGDGQYMPMLLGSKAEQRKWWLYNRFRYLDSKYNAGDSVEDYIMLRSYGVSDIEVSSYADIYAAAHFDSEFVKKRCLRGDTVTLENNLTGGNEGVISVYSASQLASVGDLSGLKLGGANFSKAIRLSSLKVGDGAQGYSNPNLTELIIGNLTLLRTLDVRNSPNLKQTVQLQGCTNIEHVYFDGTAIQGLDLPNGGILKTLHLPDTMKNLTILNQRQLNDFVLGSYANLETLRLENINFDVIDPLRIMNELPAKSEVRLRGVDWSFANSSELSAFIDKLDTFCGMDEHDNWQSTAVVEGRVYTPTITSDELDRLRTKYPTLRIEYDTLQVKVKFLNHDGTELKSQTLSPGSAIIPPIDPIREDTAQYDYTFLGWTLNGELVTNFGVAGETSLTYEALYSEEIRKYTIRFYNGVQLLQESEVEYGAMPVYNGSTPVNPNDGGDFTCWEPELAPVTGDASYNAQFAVKVRFMNDGVLVTEQILEPGDPITLPTNPTKTSTVQYNYRFKGWSRDGINVEDVGIVGSTNITYHAVFEQTLRKYKVRFVNGSAAPVEIEVEYGATPVYPHDTPSNTNGEGAFFEWQPALKPVTGDATYSAQYYSVIKFYSEGAVVATYSVVPGEVIPIPDSPTKEDVGNHTYEFKGWSTDGTNVTDVGTAGNSDTSYYAVFKQYTKVSIKFYNGNTLLSEQTYKSGDTIISPTKPTKASTTQYIYTFKGWSTDGTNVVTVATAGTSDVTYYAVFTSSLRSYTVKFFNGDGTLLETQTLPYGSTPAYTGTTPVDPSGDEGEFDGWAPAIVAVTGNANYTAQFSYGPQLAYSPVEGGYRVDGIGDVTDTDIVIPAVYRGQPVVRVAGDAFYDCHELTSVIIGANVVSIGDYAFGSCFGLSSVVFGDSVTYIDEHAFSSCTSLTSIVIPDSVTSIGEKAFEGCSSLAEVYYKGTQEDWNNISIAGGNEELISATIHFISEGLEYTLNRDKASYRVTGIGDCTDTVVIIPATYEGLPVTSIGDSTFYGCSSLTSIVIPDSVTSIGNYAFYGCSSLTSIVIPDDVTSIGYSAFRYCSSLTSIVIPDSVTYIGDNAFYECNSLTSIVIPDSVTNIDNHAFYGCSSLTFVEIPDGVVTIGKYAFCGCYALSYIIIPNSVTSIGSDAFRACTSLENVYYVGGESEWNNIIIGDDNGLLTEANIHFISAGLEYQLTDDGTSYMVTGIGTCTDTDIRIPGHYAGLPVTSIDKSAFHSCSSLTSVVIGNGVTSIGESAFAYCSLLTSIVIPDGVTIIAQYTFQGCSSLTSIVIPDSVTSVGNGAFYGGKVKNIYYTGSQAEWNSISIWNWGNDCLTSATIHYNYTPT